MLGYLVSSAHGIQSNIEKATALSDRQWEYNSVFAHSLCSLALNYIYVIGMTSLGNLVLYSKIRQHLISIKIKKLELSRGWWHTQLHPPIQTSR